MPAVHQKTLILYKLQTLTIPPTGILHLMVSITDSGTTLSRRVLDLNNAYTQYSPYSTPGSQTLFSISCSTIPSSKIVKPIFHQKLGSRWVPNANEIYTKNMKYTWPTPAFCVGTQRNLYSTDWRRGLALGLTQI